jgi:hypothetical protein
MFIQIQNTLSKILSEELAKQSAPRPRFQQNAELVDDETATSNSRCFLRSEPKDSDALLVPNKNVFVMCEYAKAVSLTTTPTIVLKQRSVLKRTINTVSLSHNIVSAIYFKYVSFLSFPHCVVNTSDTKFGGLKIVNFTKIEECTRDEVTWFP